MTLSEAERAALAQVLETQPDLNRWRLRAQRIEEPEAGSELAIDDKVFPHMEISQLVRLLLIFSGEHLRLALDALKAQQLYPASHFTVLRGALVGAAQGVWILSPDDQEERQERGLTVLAKMFTQMRKYYNDLGELSQDDHEELEVRQKWLRKRSASVVAARSSKADLNLTEVIDASARTVFADVGHQESIRRLWREMSGTAHALAWSVFQGSSLGPPDRRTGLSEGTTAGSRLRVRVTALIEVPRFCSLKFPTLGRSAA